MTISRSSTQKKQKSQRRNKAKLLFIMFGVIVLVIIAMWLWSSQNDRGTGERQPDSSESIGTASPGENVPSDKPTPTEKPSNESNESNEPIQENSEQLTPAEEDETAPSDDGGDTISLALVGDILPGAIVLEYMKKNGYDFPYREASSLLRAADITAGNLESAITTRGTSVDNKKYIYRAPPETLPAIKEAGFDYLSLANNHTLDYGWEGLSDTMDYLDDIAMSHSGSGNDEGEAYTPAYIERNGMTVAFLSVSRVIPDGSWKAGSNKPGLADAYSPVRTVAAIAAAKENADIVVVMVHWGEEEVDDPVEHQTDLAHRFIDAGADLIVGSHPHVLQGFESYKGKWIAYSLGNFVFPRKVDNPKTEETGVLKATCDKEGSCSLTFHPMLAKNAQPAPMEVDKGKVLLKHLSEVSIRAAVEEDGSIVAIP